MLLRTAILGLSISGVVAVKEAAAAPTRPAAAVDASGDRQAKRFARKGGQVAVARGSAVLPPARPGELRSSVGEAASDASAADTPVLPLTFERKANATDGFWVGADTVEIAGISATLRPTFLHDHHVLPPLPVIEGGPAAADAEVVEQPAPLRGVFAALPPARPRALRGIKELNAIAGDATATEPAETPALPAPTPSSLFGGLFNTPAPANAVPDSSGPTPGGRGNLNDLIATYARLNSVPESLVHRVVVRESRYNPRAVGRGGAMGLMQIKTGTARGLGYTGGSTGLLDAETNLTYAVKYLAGAYRTAGGNHDRAVAFYARGYYYAAKHQGLTDEMGSRRPRLSRSAPVIPDPPTTATLSAVGPTASASDQR